MSRLSHERARQIARRTWIIFLFVEAITLIITLSAFADVLFGFGWGYDWKTVIFGFGGCLWGLLVWAACRTVFRLFGVET